MGVVFRMGFVLVLVHHPVLAAPGALQGWLRWKLRDRSWLVARNSQLLCTSFVDAVQTLK